MTVPTGARNLSARAGIAGTDLLAVPLERALAILAACIALLITTHALSVLVADSLADGMVERTSGRGNPVYLLLFAAQGGIFALLLAVGLVRSGVDVALAAAGLVCLLATGSVLWSVGPGTTLMNALVLSNQVLAAYVMAVHLSPRLFLRIFFNLSIAIVLLSFAVLAVAPELAGSARYGGGWLNDIEFRGIMGSKNYAGMLFAATALFALHGDLLGVGRFVRLTVGPLAVVAVVLANSATALIALIGLGALTMALRLMGPGRGRLFFFLYLAMLASVFLIPFADPGSLTGAVGREGTLTGRTDLWATGLSAFADRPLLGHGYYGFYDPGAYSPAWRMWEQSLYFFADNFHNSAIDIAVSLGLAGLLILAGVCVTAATVALRGALDEADRLLAMILLSVYTIGSTMELAILHHNHVATLLVFYLAFVALGAGFSRGAPA